VSKPVLLAMLGLSARYVIFFSFFILKATQQL
jgi:hypothetical protein